MWYLCQRYSPFKGMAENYLLHTLLRKAYHFRVLPASFMRKFTHIHASPQGSLISSSSAWQRSDNAETQKAPTVNARAGASTASALILH